MSQDMSTFFTGVRRTRTRTRTAAGPGGADSARRPGARAGAESKAEAPFDRHRPVTTRLTGGGLVRIGTLQSTATTTLRRPQTGAMPPPRITLGAVSRRFREVEWIMKPSRSFVQCSESSSPDSRSIMSRRSRERNRSNGSTTNAKVNYCSEDAECSSSSSSERLDAVLPTQQLENLLKSSYRPGEPMASQVRAKKRSSRVFCVPGQQAEQLLHSRKNKSHMPVHSTQAQVHSRPSKCSMDTAPSRKASAQVLVPPENPYTVPSSGFISCLASPNATPKVSQTQVQPLGQRSSLCSLEKSFSCSGTSTSTSSSSGSDSPRAKPTTSSHNSSLSTSGTECSVERVVQRYRCATKGSKAIKLTSTVIKIMPDKTRSKILHQKSNDLARKTPTILLPPKAMPKVEVSKSMISQSVSHVVNQLTARLKKAATHQPVEREEPTTTEKKKKPRKLAKKTSIYLLMDQARSDEPSASTKNDWVIQPIGQQIISLATDHRTPSGSEHVNPYMTDSQDNVGHNYDKYIKMPTDCNNPEPITPPRRKLSRKQQPLLRTLSQLSLKPESGISSGKSFNPSLLSSERSLRTHSRSHRSSLMSQPVSLNRIPRPRLPAVPLPQRQPKQVHQPEVEVVNGAAGKIVRKAQHKVPRTMEDGIDMSYQYFVSIPLKRGRKPQVVRYLYRPMVRYLNGLPTNRRSSKRAKHRRAAAAAAATAKQQQQQQEFERLDPDLMALGGAPLPLDKPPIIEEEKPPIFRIFDAAAALNSPYHVPPLKLKSRYMPMLEQLDQMPYPDERLNHRRRRGSPRRARAAGGSEQLPPPEYESIHPFRGERDVIPQKREKQRTPVIVWSCKPNPPVRRKAVVNYQPKPTCLPTATGAPILYHQPLHLTLKSVEASNPMIRTITYESIEQEEREEQEREELELQLAREKQLEREQLEGEQLAKEQLDSNAPSKRIETLQEALSMAKSVSFHPESLESTSAFQSSSSSSSILETKRESRKRKGKKSHAKGKGKSRSKAKGKDHK